MVFVGAPTILKYIEYRNLSGERLVNCPTGFRVDERPARILPQHEVAREGVAYILRGIRRSGATTVTVQSRVPFPVAGTSIT